MAAWLHLNRDTSAGADRVLLYDRPNARDHVLGGARVFRDGNSLPAVATLGTETAKCTFRLKENTWLRFTVGVGCRDPGLGQMAVERSEPGRD